MLDLIMLGWPWFAGAAALGALTGYVTTSRAKAGAVAPGWLILALVLALGAGAAASAAGLFEGRMAVTFDIALAMSAAYVCGLPAGRALKAPSAQQEKALVAERPVIVKSVAQTAPAPVAVAAAPVAEVAVIAPVETAPTLDAVVVAAKALDSKAVEMRTKDKATKQPAGQRPPTLAAPRGAADDLTRIKGLGPKSAEKLNALGVFHYDQIASWSRDNAIWIGAEIGVASRVERDQWIAQARKLAGVNEEESAASAA